MSRSREGEFAEKSQLSPPFPEPGSKIVQDPGAVQGGIQPGPSRKFRIVFNPQQKKTAVTLRPPSGSFSTATGKGTLEEPLNGFFRNAEKTTLSAGETEKADVAPFTERHKNGLSVEKYVAEWL